MKILRDERSSAFWTEVAAQTISNIASAIVLSILALVLVDEFFSTPNLSGVWRAKLVFEESSYEAYKGMELEYSIVMVQGALEITGSGDKFSEKVVGTDAKNVLDGKAKTPIEIIGYIEKNYLSDDRVFLTASEEGVERDYATFYDLTVIDDRKLEGRFRTTAANASGMVEWVRLD